MTTKQLIVGVAIALLTSPALAQKSKDTLRYPMQENEPTFERYTSPGAYHYVWSNAVWDDLLAFDPTTGKFLPALAKSYSQPSNTVYEYELREDVKWHDGQPFTADDVVYTLSWLTDPKTQLRYKANWDWIASVEKLGPYKVRVTAKRPVPDGLMWMASGWAIYPKHLHEPLADKSAFGDKPVGTGPYKINKVEKIAGIVAENYKDFRPTSLKPKGSFGHIVSEPIHDTGTLVAALITGKADLVADLPPDQAADLVKSGKFEVSLAPKAVGYTFLTFPSSGWKNKKMLADPKVRLALAKAIDRKALVKLKYGAWAGNMQPVEGMCDKAQLGCGYTKLYPDYDPEGAKKLLAEAGYPEGFDVGIAAFQKYVPEAVAISGMFRSIGVKANVTPISITQRVSLLNQGRVEIGLFGWSGGASFEVSPQIVRHFLSNDYDDQPMNVEASKTLPIIDDAERRKAVGKVFDQITEKAYAFPMTPSPEIYTHTKDVKLLAPPDLIHPAQTVPVHKFGWK